MTQLRPYADKREQPCAVLKGTHRIQAAFQMRALGVETEGMIMRSKPHWLAAAAALLVFAGAATAVAQVGALAPPPAPPPVFNPSTPSAPLIVPAPMETPVSPTTPGTLPGMTAGSGALRTGINPVTGQPCSGGSSLSLNGIPQIMAPEQGPGGPGRSASPYASGGAGNLGPC